MELKTTLRLLKERDACVDGYRKLRRSLAKGWKLDQEISLLHILESNGIDDALWALRAVIPEQEADRDRIARLMAADCAERVLPLYEKSNPGDDRPRKAVEAARAFALGEIAKEELAAAQAAAWAATWDAAWDAAWAATGDAAWAAAWAAARDAARDAAWAAARDAARDVEREWQKERFRQYLKGEVGAVKAEG